MDTKVSAETTGGTQVAEKEVAPDYGFRWLSAWQLHVALLLVLSLGLVKPLSSDVPLVAIYFPGAFLFISLWALIARFAGWKGPALVSLPSSLYLIGATTALFVGAATTGEGLYRRTALVSLLMTIPFGSLGIAMTLLRHRLPGGRDYKTPDSSRGT